MRPRPINPSTATMMSTTINSGNVVPRRKAPFRWRPTHHTISELASHHPRNADAIRLSRAPTNSIDEDCRCLEPYLCSLSPLSARRARQAGRTSR